MSKLRVPRTPFFVLVPALVVIAGLVQVPVAGAEVIRGGAVLSSVSSVVKISREGNGLDSLVPGEILYVFTESGEPISQIIVKDVFSDEVYSEPLPGAVARQIRDTRSILVFSNLLEYGDFIKAFRRGTLESFGDFIDSHPSSELRPEAQHILDGLIYRPYKIRGTPEALDEFVRDHPDNSYVPNALKRRDGLRFIPVKAVDTISEYRRFIFTYPDNIHAGEAKERMAAIMASYEDAALEEIARYPRRHLGKKVKFSGILHSALPIYVEGPGVGRKTALFKSPRNALEYLNLQVSGGDIVLWRLFVNRENENLVSLIEESEKGVHLRIYGVVFDTLGGAPWIDVDDIEK